MLKELNESNFKTEIIDFNGPALVDFWAPWCGPCRVMGPIVHSLAEKFEGKVKVAKVNIDENQALAGEFGIASIPTFLFFKNGKQVFTHLGAIEEEELESMVKQHLIP